MAKRAEYIVSGIDSAGTEFELGRVGRALEALALVRGAEAKLVGARTRVRLADGPELDMAELTERATLDVQRIGVTRARAAREEKAED